MAIARSSLVKEGVEGVFHCISRCVRRAFLCGKDPIRDQNYDHRKGWIYLRLKELAGIFLIDVCGYAVMENHLHVILRTRPDLVGHCSNDEIARRWWQLFPKRRNIHGQPEEPTEEELVMILAGEGRVCELRQRLSSLSWFMRCLKENIAKRANAEDECTGRFWEGRFKSIALLDQAAVLTCAAYVDLNPIRAGIAQTPETSSFTSARERILARQARKKLEAIEETDLLVEHDKALDRLKQQANSAEWLCPFKNKPGRRGFLSLDQESYLDLLDWTGRQFVAGKKGAIPPHLAPILERLEVDHQQWLISSRHFDSMFFRVAGKVSSMIQSALCSGQKWMKGKQSGEIAFLPG